MSLLDRILGLGDEDKIASHTIMAVIAEHKRGHITKAEGQAMLELSDQEAAQLQELLDSWDAASIDRQSLHDILLLGETRLYDKAKVKSRLNVASD